MKIENWQLGEESEILPLQRIELHEEWLKKIHNEIKSSTGSTKEEEVILGGFVDID